ncbi:hypothetical protein IQ241_23445 [Romeria aff. gracilis LEGE 07310]|uniref:Uncharacterized protein n=1 Tax=Vasconcelosia minhoensis LEGE 07310 TaxID=915328 RepID=A0A8J7ATF7_9CYAN|nr:hypothetical protein [Romeria gracilis]MBE9080205.1 hypothetical protein [Romeria aff. gracilis LEGE 07310]
MSQQLTLSDEVYADLQRKAAAAGLTPTEWVIAALGQNDALKGDSRSPEQLEEARQRFRSFAGAFGPGCAADIDNEGIDADLARAYADEY